MANLEPGKKVDRTGGDNTKAEVITPSQTPKTTWDALNANGPIER